MRDFKWTWTNFKEVGILVIGAMLVMALFIHDGNSDAVIRTGLRNRAEICRLELGLGIPFSEHCTLPEMKLYFDHNEKIITSVFRAQCSTLKQVGLITPEGCPDEP